MIEESWRVMTKRRLLVFVMILTSTSAFAHDAYVVSKGFEVCINGVGGLTLEPKKGIDAVEGKIKTSKAFLSFMVSRNPTLPAPMHLKSDDSSLIARRLMRDMTFIAESAGPHDTGIERLYAFSKRNVTTPMGSIQDQIFVQLWSDGQRRNDVFVKGVGDALIRCH
jgi:hypothetical protein